MWIHRDLELILKKGNQNNTLPVKVLKGPRQVGKTSLLERATNHRLILFDDLSVRSLARENPRLFFQQFSGSLILDEATLAPELFPEIKRRVDMSRRALLKNQAAKEIDLWITGSNQTLLHSSVQESLAGRASYFDLNTLSLHESEASLSTALMRGGWPELYSRPDLDPVQYLNDLIATFIERDIVVAAGIERKAAFSKALQLAAGRVGQLLNYSDIARTVGAEVSTVASWFNLLEQNGILRLVQPYYTNHNQRLIKTPKVYFEDVGLATRLQGWTAVEPLVVSPYFGPLVENLALNEITRYFHNSRVPGEVFFVRSKEKVEVDFLIKLPNHQFVAAEVKVTPQNYGPEQMKLLESLKVNIIDKWVISPDSQLGMANAKCVDLSQIYERLSSS